MPPGPRSRKRPGSILPSISHAPLPSGSWSVRLTRRRSTPICRPVASAMRPSSARGSRARFVRSHFGHDRRSSSARRGGSRKYTAAIQQCVILGLRTKEPGCREQKRVCGETLRFARHDTSRVSANKCHRHGTRPYAGCRRSVDRCRGLPARPRSEGELREEKRGGVRPECVRETLRRTPDWGKWGCIAGRPANVAQGVKILSANAKRASGARIRSSGPRPPSLA
jgi:hypothetical protein